MKQMSSEDRSAGKRRPGQVRDAILAVLADKPDGASTAEIIAGVETLIGKAVPSSVRSYLNLNTPEIFERSARGRYSLRGQPEGRSTPAKKKARCS